MEQLTRFLFAAFIALSLGAPASAGSNYKIKGEVQTQSGGYRHVVIVKNKTRDWLTCEVWTDVDPQHQSVRVGPRNKQSVVMQTRSELDEFIPFGYCRNN